MVLLTPMIGFAVNTDYGNTGQGCPNPDSQLSTVFGCIDKGQGSLVQFVNAVFKWVAGVIASLAVLGLIWASYIYITSAGNPDSIAKAKDIIWTSVASVVIVIFSYAFFKLLGVI